MEITEINKNYIYVIVIDENGITKAVNTVTGSIVTIDIPGLENNDVIVLDF